MSKLGNSSPNYTLYYFSLHGQHRTGPCCLESEDDFEGVAELDSYGKMLMILKKIAAGHFKL